MSKEAQNQVVTSEKYPKVILRKPAGTKETFGWAGEILLSKTERRFVPEYLKEGWTKEEINMSKNGHIVKAIADSTVYAAIKGYNHSGIIHKFGPDCIEKWEAYTAAMDARKTAKKNAEGDKEGEARKAAWDSVKEPYNRAVKRALLAMELLAEDIFAGQSPAKVIG